MKLEKLWIGDHFSSPSLPHEIFCVIDVHEYRVIAVNRTAAIKLGSNGYGYIGAAVVNFDRAEDVCFIPVERAIYENN